MTNDKLVNYLLSQWKPIAQGSACSSQGTSPCAVAQPVAVYEWKSAERFALCGLVVSGTGELDRYHKGAYKSLREEASKASLGRALQDKHYLRKHGKDAYYGQAKEAT